MAFLKTLPDPPAVIVTTAYHQYAVEGFELNVTDYLLKPFEFERFLTAVNKVRTKQQEKQALSKDEEEKDFIFVNVQKKKVKILFPEILYIESQKEYVKTHLTKMSTNEIESLLPGGKFKRIHRSFIVATDKIESYTAETVEVSGVTIPIGRGYKFDVENL